jgi:hypothetical protein
MIDEAIDEGQIIRAKFEALRPVMDERVMRLWAGAEADALGDGGIAIVGRATGLSRTTIRAGRDELRAGATPDEVVWVRRPGRGRPRIETTTPAILDVLEALVDPVTRGDPESPLRWTSKSTLKLPTNWSVCRGTDYRGRGRDAGSAGTGGPVFTRAWISAAR